MCNNFVVFALWYFISFFFFILQRPPVRKNVFKFSDKNTMVFIVDFG